MKPNISLTEFNVTPELFLKWRSPRFGDNNPTCHNNAVWEWLIRSKISAYQASEELNVPSSFKNGPTWCFERFGQSLTSTPDGRIIYIGGEHEDYYDPDFCIYNDVIVLNPDDTIDIYGYPKDVFPPTDFHTATLVGEEIIIIGSLGYSDKRLVNETQVCLLNIKTFDIKKISASGNPPGWIYKHTATLTNDKKSIIIKNGKLDLGEDYSLTENIDEWKLSLNDWKWERLTHRKWARWEVRRCDRKSNSLWEIREAMWDFENKWQDSYNKTVNKLKNEIGKKPDFKVLKILYSPDIPHLQLPEDVEKYNVFKIKIADVVIRYVEESDAVQVTVEGDLPDETINILKSDLLEKTAILENTKCELLLIQNV